MYDINTKNVKKGKNLYMIFLIAGLVFLLIMIGILVSGYLKLQSLDSEVLSTNVEVNSYIDDEGNVMYRPTYHYVVNGREYMCSLNSSSSRYPKEENKTVHYDSDNPANCMVKDKTGNIVLILCMSIPLVFIIVAVVNFRKVNKRIAQIEELNQKGKLVKNLPYRLENTGIVVNGIPIQRPVVDYTLPNGATITLYGDPRHDKKTHDADGMVDLVIDEVNPENYFIDFEINRLSGNTQSDYYIDPRQNNNQNNTYF